MFEFDWLRVYLLAGLAAHKTVWEVMKRQPTPPKPKAVESLAKRLIKLVKIGILLGLLGQTLLPDILPLTADPKVLRVAGTILYTIGLTTALAGRIQLGRNWSDIEVAVVRQEHRVVSEGIYQYVRHPIYSGDLLLLVGVEFALNSWLVVGALMLIPVVLHQTMREEEALRAKLPGYGQYCRRTKRFIPFLA